MRTTSILLAFATTALVATAVHATPIGTSFGYQGRLLRNGTPVQGVVNLRYTLWDDAVAGLQQGAIIQRMGVSLTDGLVTDALDFGAVFDGNQRWLQVEVQGQNDPNFVLLTPRQELLPTPYALWAAGGGSALNLPFSATLSMPVPLFEVINLSNAANSKGVRAEASRDIAIEGVLHSGNKSAVQGTHLGENVDSGAGVHGIGLTNAMGVLGDAQTGAGVRGNSQTGTGVWGSSLGGAAGVFGENNTAFVNAAGVRGWSTSIATGVHGYSNGGFGVLGETSIANKAGVKGQTSNPGAYGGWFANTAAGGVALYAEGEAQVKVLTILGGADLAERFDVGEDAEPGTVMAIDPGVPGRLVPCDEAYCPRVAGVVSGANDLSAGVVLGETGSGAPTRPIALSGRAWVRCDAGAAPIRPGDLLTSAPRQGYAMRALDSSRATGAVIGKAMSSLETGTGLVLVLVNLQ